LTPKKSLTNEEIAQKKKKAEDKFAPFDLNFLAEGERRQDDGGLRRGRVEGQALLLHHLLPENRTGEDDANYPH